MKNRKTLLESIKIRWKDAVILIIVMILYVVNNKIIKVETSGLVHLFFVCYFNDLMAPMFMLSYSNILLQTQNRNISKYIHTAVFCLIVGIIWELFAPFVKHIAVRDFYDIVCYLIGGNIYWILIGRKGTKND